MKLSIDELMRSVQLGLMHLKASGVEEVEISKDYYWHIPDNALYDPYNEPKEFTLGQLSDDAKQVHEIASGSREPIGYSLVWCAAVLRYVGNAHMA